MITFDTETCGLFGPIVLIQYAYDYEPVQLYCPWKNKIKDTISLFEMIVNHKEGVLGFNLAFDWFHLCQMYTTLLLMKDKEAYLENCIEEYANNEPLGRDGPCLKPYKACDVMLWARKGPYQSTMDRKDITIKKIPTALAYPLAKELEKRVPFKDIYFARRKKKNEPKWQVFDIKDELGDCDSEWKDIKVKFKPSSALKALAQDALNIPNDEVLLFGDISPKLFPIELGYAPFALAAMSEGIKKGKSSKWRGTWPELINHHISHWAYHELARKYAERDVIYTRDLYKVFGSPEFGDDDSELACCIAACRWKGYRIDIEGIKQLKDKAKSRRYKEFAGEKWKIPTAPAAAKKYILSALSETERVCLQNKSTKKTVLEEMSEFKIDCPECEDLDSPNENCLQCKGFGEVKHPVAIRAKEVLDARKVDKEIELYDKLLIAGRLHASFKVIGTLSSRMAGADKLNAQAIKKTKEVKSQFPFAFDNEILAGGDYSGFEVTIGVAVYGDPDLEKDLLTCEKCESEMIFDQKSLDYKCTECGSSDGKKIHALFGVHVYPNMTYEQIKATEGTEDDKYTKSKSSVFAMMYGGEGYTLMTRLGVPIEVADLAVERFGRKYKNVGRKRAEYKSMFSALSQPNGIGSQVRYKEPVDKIETLLGFPRYFTLENRIIKALYDLANKPPPAWKEIKIKVQRRDRVQTAGGAVASALYAAAFAIQGSNIRAGGNHVIQGTGAQITKRTQRNIWNIQPCGINKWIVRPMNIHDSVMVPVDPNYVEKVKQTVIDTVESFRSVIPLIKMPWKSYLKNWADKGK